MRLYFQSAVQWNGWQGLYLITDLLFRIVNSISYRVLEGDERVEKPVLDVIEDSMAPLGLRLEKSADSESLVGETELISQVCLSALENLPECFYGLFPNMAERRIRARELFSELLYFENYEWFTKWTDQDPFVWGCYYDEPAPVNGRMVETGLHLYAEEVNKAELSECLYHEMGHYLHLSLCRSRGYPYTKGYSEVMHELNALVLVDHFGYLEMIVDEYDEVPYTTAVGLVKRLQNLTEYQDLGIGERYWFLMDFTNFRQLNQYLKKRGI
jgi:hypothetical protein